MSPRPHPLLHVQETETVTRVTIAAEDLDEANLQDISEGLFTIADGLSLRGLELDMARVRYLTSTCLGKIVALNTRVKDGGGKLVVTNVSPRAYEVFEVTRLHRVLDIRGAAGAAPHWSGSAPLAS